MNEENVDIIQDESNDTLDSPIIQQYREVYDRLEETNNKLDELLEEYRGESEEQTEEQSEEQTEEQTEEQDEEQELLFLDDSVDGHLYLSTKVENADINDLYSIGLSIRNILLLFVLIVVCWKLYKLLKSAIYKVFNL